MEGDAQSAPGRVGHMAIGQSPDIIQADTGQDVVDSDSELHVGSGIKSRCRRIVGETVEILSHKHI